SVRSNSPPRFESFTVTVPPAERLEVKDERKRAWIGKDTIEASVVLPSGAKQVIAKNEPVRVDLPADVSEEDLERLKNPDLDAQGTLVSPFPPKCPVRQPPVPRYRLAVVIALAVASICLWGTFIGSMLPLLFKRIGVDPGIASSPFVATFVDV